MKKLTPPEIILFDWHATLVDTPEALYHALDDLLPQLEALLAERLGADERPVRQLRPAHRVPRQGLAFQESQQASRIGRVGLLVLLQLIGVVGEHILPPVGAAS
jgi:beta-phosphoglucomutase-like phosphatase (HAD superfamily)